MTMLKYVSSIVNIANQFCQATRAKHVGQLSNLIMEYRDASKDHSKDGWSEFYNKKEGFEKIDTATDKIWSMIENMKGNLDQLKKEDVRDWVENLIIEKTFSGLQIQLRVLKSLSKKSYRLADAKEESMGIDGFIDGVPVQIKPHTYKASNASTKEKIPFLIIYYKKKRNGDLEIL